MAEMKMVPNAVPGTDGNKYIPMEERTGNQSIVYLHGIFLRKACRRFTRR